MTTVAIIGPGAIGGTLAAWLSQDPDLDVTICARTAFDHLRVEVPGRVLECRPRVLTDPAQASPVDWVLVATKTYDVEGTRPWLEGLVAQGTRVAIVQNGVEHKQLFSHLVPEQRLLPVMINLPAARSAPGRITQYRPGFMKVPAGELGDDFARLFRRTEVETTTDSDFVSALWIKLCGNSTTIVPALTLRATSPVWSHDLERIVRAVAEECAAVGRAEGATIPQDVVDRAVEASRTMPEGSSAGSLHADRLAGHPMEVDTRNGVIVRLGRKHGIPTPINAMLVTLLEAAGSPWIER